MPGDIIILRNICYAVTEICRASGCNCCFLFWAIFCSFTPSPLLPKEMPGYIILHMCTKNYDQIMCDS